MEFEIQRTDTQPSGPRVSFNRDVHVKRIGKRLNESTNYSIQTRNLHPPETSHLRREPPTNLDQKSILKEAALVLKQAERTKCKAETIEKNKISTRSLKNKQQPKPIIHAYKFNSLPTRKKSKSGKLVTRSVSDVSAKKNKKPSIFNVFSRKSDTNLSLIEEDARFKESGGRRLIRSKSNIVNSVYNRENQKYLLNNNLNNENTDNVVMKPGVSQLSPIIENTRNENYFNEMVDSNHTLKNKALENNTTNENTEENTKLTRNSHNRLSNKENSPPDITSSLGVNVGNNQFSIDLMTTKGTQNSKELKSEILPIPINSKAKYKNMHSSQLPPEKLPLTKGLTVDGMVKRLILERFSPPPTISGPAFSYTRPNEPIIYAQLAPEEFEDRIEEMFPKTSTREMESPTYKAFTISNSYKGVTEDRTPNYFASHNNSSSNNKSEIYLNGVYQHNQEPKSVPATLYRGRGSPTQWSRLSPHNLSDDEGLGFEPKKDIEHELSNPRNFHENYLNNLHQFKHSKSFSTEPLIVPVIHGSSPSTGLILNRRRGDYFDACQKDNSTKTQNGFNNLRSRREALESKIHSRKFASNKWEPETGENYSPLRETLNLDEIEYPIAVKRDEQNERINRNLINEYYINQNPYSSPEKRNIDKLDNLHSLQITDSCLSAYPHPHTLLTPKETTLKSSKYTHTKYFDDGTGRYKEVHEKETSYDEEGKPRHAEFIKKERYDQTEMLKDPLLFATDRYRIDCGSQNDENLLLNSKKKTTTLSTPHDEKWLIETLTQDKRKQRSLDKGDSGIENDLRKESFNSDLNTKCRNRIPCDVMKACELFIKKERRHTEDLHQNHKKYDFVFRERSIDDGSHFDPRLDKYPKDSTLRHKETFPIDKKQKLLKNSDLPNESCNLKDGTIKNDRKIGGLERVKKLFGGKKKGKKEFSYDNEKNNSREKDSYMVNEEEMRTRYMEYRGPEAKQTYNHDISTRRRLSTPRASPSLKRVQSDEEIQSSLVSQKLGENVKVEKTNWFKSLDRSMKKKNEKRHLASSSFRTPTKEDLSVFNKTHEKPLMQQMSGKNFRFFGDTDMESNPPTISKATTSSRIRNDIEPSILNRSQKYSQSAYNLDRIPKKSVIVSQKKSSSMQNLDEGNDKTDNIKITRHHSRSKSKLNDISESGSETEGRDVSHRSVPKVPSRDKKPGRYRYSSNVSPHRSSNDRDSKSPHGEVSSDPARTEFRKPPPGPQKPMRSADRFRQSSSLSRERDRLHDSSGTEGDSSLHSQRSVVYLHATTVGDIPQPYQMSPSKRRTSSRDNFHYKRPDSLHNTQNPSIEPMAKSVSRSVSMSAPWTPKRRSDGYEIDYSPDTAPVPIIAKPMPRVSRKYSGSVNSLGRSKNNHSKPRKYKTSKEDLSLARNITSRSGLSNRSLLYEKQEHGTKHDLSRRTVK